MAQGDITLFNSFKTEIGAGTHLMGSHSFKVGLITTSTTPASTTAVPRWGTGGTTNLSTNQVAAGGNYSAGGAAIGSTTWTEVGGYAVFNGTLPDWAQNASNPTNARWGIIYNDTAANKPCVGFIDLGGVINMTAGALNLTENASGIARF